MIKLSEKIKKINIEGSIDFNVELKEFSTFKTGGPSDIFIKPLNFQDIQIIKDFSLENNIPCFVLGGGANLLISDKGIRGITLYTGEMTECFTEGFKLISQSGISVNKISEKAMKAGLSGLEFIYGMPGTIGGALWMNARCYGGEISHIFDWADVLNEKNEIERITFKEKDWSYKHSPFQDREIIIVQSCFNLKEGDFETIKREMDKNYNDRKNKGHFFAPCAGSVFKNDRDFGKPSGQIIDELGLRGMTIGDAAVSDFHANIIINKGNASASDILSLINCVKVKVKEQTGFELEPEVIPVGDWR
ncbi:MAG: UDP-N-acetylmuramate dehydrogenase [Spirochaetaceae bacterium]|nr:UDP-N-acetylmuramate dehydrogenase [Spirochaetaceae bacterium]